MPLQGCCHGVFTPLFAAAKNDTVCMEKFMKSPDLFIPVGWQKWQNLDTRR